MRPGGDRAWLQAQASEQAQDPLTMPQHGTGDPLLKGADWETIKAFWRQPQNHRPCARCGGPIRYTGPRGWDSLDVGHIVGRDEARRLGWTREQINHLSNTQPEHARCGRSAGATYGNEQRWSRSRLMPIEHDEW